jgi:peptide-methionine (S)-S-oxide reductase
MGGITSDPTYYHLGDHTETVQFDFDPAVVSYEELVEAFFAFHDATRSNPMRQYMSAVFAHDEEQEATARAVMQRVQAGATSELRTVVMVTDRFYMAEDYHQKYALRMAPDLFEEYRAMYPDFWELVDSAAATKVNAYLYGCGTEEQLEADIDLLGLSSAGQVFLLTNARM